MKGRCGVVCDKILRQAPVIARDPALREPSPDLSGRGNLKSTSARVRDIKWIGWNRNLLVVWSVPA